MSSKKAAGFACITHLVMLISFAAANFTEDSKECSDKLASLSPCLSFVGGDTKSPAPTCCTNLRREINTTKKCLCLLVKDRNDPQLGFKINATLALSLPSICHAPANISECPELLHLAPHSPDAQVFEQFVAPTSNSSTPAVADTTNSASASGNPSENKLKILQASTVACISAAIVGL